MDFSRQTVSGLSALLRKNEATQEDVLESLAKAIRERDGDSRGINAYVRRQTLKSVRCLPAGRQGKADKNAPLWGVPIALKDNICAENFEVTCASNILKGFISPYNATVVERLLDAGAVLYGQTNMDEFAFGSSCETSSYGPTRNPRDPERVPGGSSGGSAAAVADHTAIAALGSDTGGSIRQPAAFCGVVGIKPTYGRVSRYGLVAFASSLDQIGPITKDVRDAALLLGVIAGHDPKDSTTADVPVPDYTSFLGKDVRDLKIGIAKQYQVNGLRQQHPVVGNALDCLQKLGIQRDNIREVDLPHIDYAVNAYYIIAPSEASSNLARFDGVRFGYRNKSADTLLGLYEKSRGEGFGAEAKRRIMLGTYSLSSGYYDAYYLRAMKIRTKIKQDFDKALEHVDVIITPTAPTEAFKLGEKTQNPLDMYLSDIFTISANLAGVPAISIPIELDPGQKMPFGIQFLGRPFEEGTLFQIAYAFEQATGYHKKLGNVR